MDETKPFDPGVLLNAIRHAIRRSEVALGRETEFQTLRADYLSLTRREREVMTLVVAGLLNKQAGGELGISEITVKAHRGNVMRKMKADSFADLVNMAARLRVTRSLAHAPFRGDDSQRRAWRQFDLSVRGEEVSLLALARS